MRKLFDLWEDPVLFGEWLYETPLDEWQRSTLRRFVQGGRVARAVCNGGGKTRLFAIAGLWLLVKRKNVRVVMTAGAFRQCMVMRDELVKVMHKLPGFVLKEQELVHPNGDKFLWYSADNPGLFEGQHAENLALFVDESKSFPDEMSQASERLQAKYTLCMSSPGSAQGWFYDCFSSKRKFWDVGTVNALEILRIDRKWIADQIEMYGEKSALVRSMIYAQFIDISEGSLIQLEWINRILKNPPRFDGGYKVAGIDLSASVDGDESVIVVRDGNKITDIVAWRDEDPMRVAGKCIVELTRMGVPRDHVFADAGGLGSGIVARMKEIGWPVIGVQFGGSPLQKSERVINRMTEVWDYMANQIELGRIILPEDKPLIAQLTSRKAVVMSSGRLRLETKAEMKKRLGSNSSPDRADALALALQTPQSNKVFSITKMNEETEREWDSEENGGEKNRYNTTHDGVFLGN